MASDDGGLERAGTAPLQSDAAATVAPSVKATLREARLRPEFARTYVGIEPSVWFSAAGLAEQLITRLLRDGVPDEDLPHRVLDPTHFEFRGGESSASRSTPGR